jgi:hypothetical protein
VNENSRVMRAAPAPLSIRVRTVNTPEGLYLCPG